MVYVILLCGLFLWFPQMGLSFLGIYHASAAYNLSLTKKEEVCIGLV